MLAKQLYKWTTNLPMSPVNINNQPYLERYVLAKMGSWNIYLYRFVRDNSETALHDNPWRWACLFVLSGHYKERLATMDDPSIGYRDKYRWIRWFNWITPHTRHQVVNVKPETWILLLTGKRIKDWGFYQHIEHGYYYHQPLEASTANDWHNQALSQQENGRATFTQKH